MNITLKRHYGLILALVAIIAICIFGIGSVRIISYNFGEGKEIEIEEKNYTNTIELFDDSVVHEITISMANGDYEEMISTYQEAGLKEYFQADITIDGVEIKNIGIRLKGNLTLMQSLGGNMGGGDMGGGNGGQRPEMPEGFKLPEGVELPEGFEIPKDFVPPENPFSETLEEIEGEPPFLIKFDEFVVGQEYQGYTEIALRIGSFNSDAGLLKEQIAFYIHDQVGQIVPQTAYAYIKTDNQEPSLYVITENLDQTFIEKNFEDPDGILYKAGNFVGFEYLGEDPTLYAEKYEQETNVNKDDLSPLINFLKFVSESTDEEFEANLPKWIDMESFIRMMALDNLLKNDDSFVGMGSNYYLYYDKKTDQFTMLSWDMNLAMGSMGGGGGMGNRPARTKTAATETGATIANAENAEKFAQMRENMEKGGMGGGGMGRNGTNTLKTRFFANKNFSEMYNEEYARLKKLIYEDGLALEKVEELAKVFTTYNAGNKIMEQTKYDEAVTSLKSFIEQQK